MHARLQMEWIAVKKQCISNRKSYLQHKNERETLTHGRKRSGGKKWTAEALLSMTMKKLILSKILLVPLLPFPFSLRASLTIRAFELSFFVESLIDEWILFMVHQNASSGCNFNPSSPNQSLIIFRIPGVQWLKNDSSCNENKAKFGRKKL